VEPGKGQLELDFLHLPFGWNKLPTCPATTGELMLVSALTDNLRWLVRCLFHINPSRRGQTLSQIAINPAVEPIAFLKDVESYSIQWSTTLVADFQTLETGIEHPQGSYTDTTHNAESEGFYRVDVQLK